MLRTAKCKFCPFTVTKNGLWQTKDAIIAHLQTEHKRKYAEIVEHNKRISEKMTELRNQLKLAYTFIK